MENRGKIENIQALRGIAVLLVICYHIMLHERKYGKYEWLLPDFLQVGAAGVDIFFIISGFIITTVARGRFRKDGSVTEFIWNRVTRIYPLYWFYWLLFVTALYLFPQNMATSSLGGALTLTKSFLLLPQAQFPILSVSWTLVHELYFYLVFAFFIFLDGKYLVRLLLVFLSLVAAGNLVVNLGHFGSAWLKLITHPLTVEFIGGSLISVLVFKGGLKRYGLWFLIAGGLGFAILSAVFLQPLSWEVPDGWARVLLFGLPCAVIVYGAAAMELHEGKRISKALSAVGDASYSIYLSHAMVFSTIGVLFSTPAIRTNAVMVFLMFTGAIVWGFLSYFFIERPMLSTAKKVKAYIFLEGQGKSLRS